jgi:parvulin-like peptidyl-prolyl isomerase
MSNTGVAPDQSKHEYARGSMVPAFGNVGFTLKVGDIGIADYDPRTSPYGYHVIKRLQ